MIKSEQLRELIILPALSLLQKYCDVSCELLVFTCAVESQGGTYLKQINGPALGIYQMEPATHNDIWQRYIKNRADLTLIMSAQFNFYRMPDEARLIWDLQYATLMTRIHYLRVEEALPKKDDIDGLWHYYKKYYNTEKGKAKKDASIKAYLEYTNACTKKTKASTPSSL